MVSDRALRNYPVGAPGVNADDALRRQLPAPRRLPTLPPFTAPASNPDDMALIACPDCGKQISDAAPLCIGCGRPMAGASASATSGLPAAARALAPSGLSCPTCGGDLVSYRALHEATPASDVPQVARFAPPDRALIAAQRGCGQPLLGATILAALTWYFVGGFWAPFAFVVGFLAFAKLAGVRSRPLVEERYQSALNRYERRYLCRVCGATAFRADNGSLETEDADAEIDALLRSGQKIQAIKLVRDRTGLGLKEAKDVVDAREKQL